MSRRPYLPDNQINIILKVEVKLFPKSLDPLVNRGKKIEYQNNEFIHIEKSYKWEDTKLYNKDSQKSHTTII